MGLWRLVFHHVGQAGTLTCPRILFFRKKKKSLFSEKKNRNSDPDFEKQRKTKPWTGDLKLQQYLTLTILNATNIAPSNNFLRKKKSPPTQSPHPNCVKTVWKPCENRVKTVGRLNKLSYNLSFLCLRKKCEHHTTNTPSEIMLMSIQMLPCIFTCSKYPY